ncbi:prepilin-type N-terminal cleavage/methylation domain-containing protein [Nakamurella deserti]|uniref:prepilin-type N-terminal cleavage/methylation domain-containing protein n=1 Tax=Nakamurella deserti TaxID=2164074 RepID=UPI001478DB01|nr:prepilin-type N-terminal cleavage/methylation domain-containing protein [Nakamurella deserti]
MHHRLTTLRGRKAAGDKGFTLIELLVVVVILGVLITIAIPVYLNYRKGANDAAAESDVRNAISILEVCNASDGKYPVADFPASFGSETGATVVDACSGQRYNTSKGTQLTYRTNSSGSCYSMVAKNAGGAPKYWQYVSSAGGSVAPSDAARFAAPPPC